jgi:osmotically-inducible protein OsmY
MERNTMTLTAPMTPATDEDGGAPRPGDDLLRALPAELTAGIRTSSAGGVARLRGEAPSVAAWRRIREAVLAAPGVVVVADEIQVRGARPLRGIGWTERVARSIAGAPGIEGSVAVQIDGGVVTLWGHVPNGRIRERVIGAVRDIVGGAWIQTRIATD